MYLYVHGINMSVLCSDTYVPFCPILSRWAGFQMVTGYYVTQPEAVSTGGLESVQGGANGDPGMESAAGYVTIGAMGHGPESVCRESRTAMQV